MCTEVLLPSVRELHLVPLSNECRYLVFRVHKWKIASYWKGSACSSLQSSVHGTICCETEHHGVQLKSNADVPHIMSSFCFVCLLFPRCFSSTRSSPQAPIVVLRLREGVQPQCVDLGVDCCHPPSHLVVV